MDSGNTLKALMQLLTKQQDLQPNICQAQPTAHEQLGLAICIHSKQETPNLPLHDDLIHTLQN